MDVAQAQKKRMQVENERVHVMDNLKANIGLSMGLWTKVACNLPRSIIVFEDKEHCLGTS